MMSVSVPTVAAWAAHLGRDPATLDVERLRHELAAGTLPAAFATAAAARPVATLRVGNQQRTHAQLQTQAARFASALCAAGIGKGSRLVIRAGTSMPFVACYLAALHAGATVILANPSYPPAEMRGLLTRSDATLLVTDTAEDPLTGVTTVPLAEVADRARLADPMPRAELSSSDVALLAYTSGTTGTPKGVPLTHGMVLASIRAAMWAWRWSATDTLVHALPLFHQHGLSGLHASLLTGSNAVLVPRFDPHALVGAVARADATVVFGVPAIHQRLVALPAEDLEPLRRLRLVTSGSAPLAPDLATEFTAKVGVQPLERYGLTESGLDLSNLYAGKRAVGTVGTPLPGVEVALYDADGVLVSEGADAEIALRGPQVFAGYLDDPAASEAAFWRGGWFRTGDVGRWDDAGRLVVTGRLKELVITGGMNVAPGEVERVLVEFPGIAEAAVAGLPSTRWGEEVAAWVVPGPAASIDTAAVIEHCRGELAAHKCPKRVFVVAELPRNAMGKVVRSALTGGAARG